MLHCTLNGLKLEITACECRCNWITFEIMRTILDIVIEICNIGEILEEKFLSGIIPVFDKLDFYVFEIIN